MPAITSARSARPSQSKRPVGGGVDQVAGLGAGSLGAVAHHEGGPLHGGGVDLLAVGLGGADRAHQRGRVQERSVEHGRVAGCHRGHHPGPGHGGVGVGHCPSGDASVPAPDGYLFRLVGVASPDPQVLQRQLLGQGLHMGSALVSGPEHRGGGCAGRGQVAHGQRAGCRGADGGESQPVEGGHQPGVGAEQPDQEGEPVGVGEVQLAAHHPVPGPRRGHGAAHQPAGCGPHPQRGGRLARAQVTPGPLQPVGDGLQVTQLRDPPPR